MDANLFIILVFAFALIAMSRWFKLQKERTRGVNPIDQMALDRALDQARRLEERIESLERVLDEDMPGWRRKVSA